MVCFESDDSTFGFVLAVLEVPTDWRVNAARAERPAPPPRKLIATLCNAMASLELDHFGQNEPKAKFEQFFYPYFQTIFSIFSGEGLYHFGMALWCVWWPAVSPGLGSCRVGVGVASSGKG